MFLWPCTSLYSSRHIRPATAAVVVAMAGMILPAMRLLCEGHVDGYGYSLSAESYPEHVVFIYIFIYNQYNIEMMVLYL